MANMHNGKVVSATARRPSARFHKVEIVDGEPGAAAGPTRRYAGRWAIVVLGVILLASMSLAAVWAFVVPIYQGPDEVSHLDYAFCLKDHGRLFLAEPYRPGTGLPLTHPYTHYLNERSNAGAIIYHPEVKVVPGYGTAAFYEAIDRDAPRDEHIRIDRPPGLTQVYPFGYYAVLACWMALLHRICDSLVVLFFGARLFSVLLLGCSLVLSYGIARRLRLGRIRSLTLVAIIGCFPLTTFVSSYVQPDNLSFALVSICLYLSLAARDYGCPWPAVAGLGAALGVLLVTKPHFCIAVALPIAIMLSTELARPCYRWWRRGLFAVLLAAPSVLLQRVHLWTVQDTKTFYEYTAAYDSPIRFIVDGVRAALVDFFCGMTHRSFWGVFGWLDAPMSFGGPSLDALVRFVIQVGTLLVVVLTLVRFEQLASRLLVVARRGRPWSALRIASSNPVINSYFLFFVGMVVFYVRTSNSFGAQGRNWMPLLLPIFLTATTYAPSALTLRSSRRACSIALTAALFLYSAIGSYFALDTIRDRYYPASAPATEPPIVSAKAAARSHELRGGVQAGSFQRSAEGRWSGLQTNHSG